MSYLAAFSPHKSGNGMVCLRFFSIERRPPDRESCHESDNSNYPLNCGHRLQSCMNQYVLERDYSYNFSDI